MRASHTSACAMIPVATLCVDHPPDLALRHQHRMADVVLFRARRRIEGHGIPRGCLFDGAAACDDFRHEIAVGDDANQASGGQGLDNGDGTDVLLLHQFGDAGDCVVRLTADWLTCHQFAARRHRRSPSEEVQL
jgi:hypothetical protein